MDQYYLSNLIDCKVISGRGVVLGKTSDLVVDLDQPQPEVTKLVFRAGWSKTLSWVPWNAVESVLTSGIILKENSAPPSLFYGEPSTSSQVLLRDLLLDKQIVDVHGAKVERVNDLHFCKSNGKLVLDQVDVGLRGILRRLGFENAIIRFSKWFFDYDLKEKFISWHFVQPLADFNRLRLQIAQSQLQDLHPADLADIIEDMDVHERAAVVDSLDEEVLADALEEMDPKVQVAIMRGLEPEKAADIIEEMSPDDAADLIADLPTETASGIFWEMDDDYEEKVKGLLEHDEDEAGGLMTTQFMALKPEQTIAEALNYISRHAQEMDVIYYIYVVDNDSKLLGVTNLRELLSNEIFTPIGRIMTTRVITVRINDKAEDISDLFAKYGFRGIPVVDEDNHIEGVIRFKAFLEMLAPHLGR
ncbi:MAG: CBS domain-containing protein [Desulfomonile sp.]|jgi:CBS domain-containing protein/sporulation protein YlmC with PRC-barrel domain|nr:CBS domain-containing protein [Deltaproteobacteria bacterium]